MSFSGLGVTNPLGLVAFFAFLIVYIILRSQWKHKHRWALIVPLIGMAAGLYLAFRQHDHQPIVSPSEKSSTTMSPKTSGETSQKKGVGSSVHQETHGPNSPAVQGGTGNVTIQYGAEKEKK